MEVVYKRSKVQGKTKVSETGARTSIIFGTGITFSQIIRTEHTDDEWVFVVERTQRRLTRVSKYSSS